MISRDLWNPPTFSYIASRQCHKKGNKLQNVTKKKRLTEAKFKIRFLASFAQPDKFDLSRLNLCISFPAKLYFV